MGNIKKIQFSFLKKLVISYSTVMMVLIFVLIGVAYTYIVSVSEQTTAISQKQILQKISSQIESYLDDMYKMGTQISSDARVINKFHQMQEEEIVGNYFDTNIMDSIDIRSIIASYNGPEYTIGWINVFNQYGDYVSDGIGEDGEWNKVPDRETAERFTEDIIAQKQEGKGRVFLLFLPDAINYTESRTPTMSLLVPVTNYYENEYYGFVEIQQKMEKFQAFLNLEQYQGNATIFLFDEEGRQILPVGLEFDSLRQEDFYITSEVMNGYGWNLCLMLERSSMKAPYQRILNYMIVAAFFIVVSLVFVIYVMTKKLTSPLLNLSRSVKNLTLDGAPFSFAPDDSVDEVKELNAAFLAMQERLGKSLVYEKRAILLALQSQMDPHFLYNILAVVSGIGLESGNMKIVDICSKISTMIRYNVSLDNRNVTLDDEINNAVNYLELMHIRYEDYFHYHVDIDERLRKMKMPHQVLQPILENCFEHGFKDVSPPWYIEIKGGYVEGRWFISIGDNGGGFGSEELKELKLRVEEYSNKLPENYSKLKIGGLGLVNTILRLQLLLGEEVEYEIKQNIPSGTIIILREQSSDDKDIDSGG